MLTSAARETLRGVEAVIIDEIHALAATKRGSHMALTLERLDHWVTAGGGASPQRIGLSATQRPLEEIARFLGGQRSEEHTSELQSLMRISYAVFCLKKKKTTT